MLTTLLPSDFTLVSPTSAGVLPTGVTIIGGLVLDMVGTNGARVVSQLAASELFIGYFNTGTPANHQGNPGTIGIQNGFNSTIVQALGGGISELAVRVTLFDGDTGPGDFDVDHNFLLLNGINFGNFSDVVTQERSSNGQSIISQNLDGGFRDEVLDTGFFYSKSSALLNSFYATLANGTVSYQLQNTSANPYGNYYDFKQGIDGGLVDIGQPPSLSPVAKDDSVSTIKNVPAVINVLANDFDPDGTLNPTTVTIITPTSHGTVTVNPTTGIVTYTPATGYIGPDTFTYKVKDNAQSLSNLATVSITVNPRRVTFDDSATTNENTPVTVDVLANDSGAEAPLDPSTVRIISPPTHGTVTVDPQTGKVTYTPSSSFSGSDSFTYQVTDSLRAVSNVSTVNVSVQSPIVIIATNQNPVAAGMATQPQPVFPYFAPPIFAFGAFGGDAQPFVARVDALFREQAGLGTTGGGDPIGPKEIPRMPHTIPPQEEASGSMFAALSYTDPAAEVTELTDETPRLAKSKPPPETSAALLGIGPRPDDSVGHDPVEPVLAHAGLPYAQIGAAVALVGSALAWLFMWLLRRGRRGNRPVLTWKVFYRGENRVDSSHTLPVDDDTLSSDLQLEDSHVDLVDKL